jgi:hypothetical protein
VPAWEGAPAWTDFGPTGEAVTFTHEEENHMNGELLASIEREVLSWPGVSKDPDRPNVALYRFGRRQLGHIHHDGVADLPFPRAVHDGLISDGLAEPHRGGFPATVSYYIRGQEDVPGAVDLFRMSYDRAKDAAERRERRRGSVFGENPA